MKQTTLFQIEKNLIKKKKIVPLECKYFDLNTNPNEEMNPKHPKSFMDFFGYCNWRECNMFQSVCDGCEKRGEEDE